MANMTNETLSKANGIMPEIKHKILVGENQLAKLSHDAGESVGKMTAKFVDSTTDYIKTGNEYVKENPFKVAAIAAVAGVACGSLLTWALRNRE